MDATHFDQLARVLATPGARRGLLYFLTTLPLLGGLVSLFGEDDAAAKGRRKRRRKRHKHGQGRHKTRGKRKKPCKAKSRAKTCAGQCGIVKNTCKKTVNCGSCACDPPCPVCSICNDVSGVCEPDPNQQGEACGEPGQVCQSDGTCACDANRCAPCESCQSDGLCGEPCDSEGCCDGAQCQPGNTNAACGAGGTACETCTGVDTCQSGACDCTPITTCPPPLDCGEIDDGCGGSLDCGDCTSPDTCGGGLPGMPNVCGCSPTTCVAQGKDCGEISDGCGAMLPCGTCSGNTPVCVNNVCISCSGNNPCPNGGCCAGGSCIQNGAPCNDGNACTEGDTCQNGTCSGTPVVCNNPNECQTGPGSCNPDNGFCTYPNAADGTRCGNKCTQECTAGVCGAGTPVTCSASVCQIAGTCDPATGTCSPPTNRPPGTDCSSAVPCGRCDGSGVCVGCTGTDCCGADGECHGDEQPCNPGGPGICCNRECTCFFGGVCRVSPRGAICCCTDPDQICVDIDGGSCQLP